MTDVHSDLLGEPTDPDDLQLGPVQRLVLRKLRQHGTLTTDEAGAIAHHHRGKHDVDATCQFCGVDGRELLAALVKRGLAERGDAGTVRLAGAPPSPGGGPDTAEIPF